MPVLHVMIYCSSLFKIFIYGSCLFIKLHFENFDNSYDVPENLILQNWMHSSICKTNILCSTSKLKLIMQQTVLPSFLLWKHYFKNFGDKVHYCGIQCSHHCFGIAF